MSKGKGEMTISITCEIDLIDNLIDWNDKEQKDWLYRDILIKSNLFLCDREIGDMIGSVNNITIKESKNQSNE